MGCLTPIYVSNIRIVFLFISLILASAVLLNSFPHPQAVCHYESILMKYTLPNFF